MRSRQNMFRLLGYRITVGAIWFPLLGRSTRGQCVPNGCSCCFNKTLITKIGGQSVAPRFVDFLDES